nr:uncharacterized protein LOC129164962 isoform X1 [Nothobranchius furzeri]
MEFLLRCDFEIPKLPLKLSEFHRQVLFFGKMVFKHNFSPHDVPIWNNRTILDRNKTIFVKSWMDRGIWSVTHILDENGNTLSLKNFNLKYDVDISENEYNKVIKNIPSALVHLVKASIGYIFNPRLKILAVDGIEIFNKKCNNIFLRNKLNKTFYPNPILRFSLLHNFSKGEIKVLRANYLKFSLPPKYKEVHFKILNDIHSSNHFIQTRFKFNVEKCYLCKQNDESTKHLFYECDQILMMWKSLHDWLNSNQIYINNFTVEDILFGIILKDKNNEFLINNLIILTKFFIHKCRYLKNPPMWNNLKNEIKLLLRSIGKMSTPNAIKLYDFIMNTNL